MIGSGRIVAVGNLKGRRPVTNSVEPHAIGGGNPADPGTPRYLLAQFGTFDVANYGDLLFPLVARHFLRDADMLFVSPKGGPSPCADGVTSISLDEAAAPSRQFDGILIGGGNIIHMKPTQLADYASPLGLGAAAYIGLWLGACMKAAETGAGIAWNAPGLAGPLGVPLPEGLLAACFRHSDHVALREPSHLPVSGPNAIEGLQIVPDPVVALSDVWPEADLATLLPDLSARYALAPSYTVFHAKQRNLRDRAGIATARTLLARLEVAGPVLLVPFGRVHQDDLALSELVHGLPGRFRLAGPELTLRETTALIAGARLVVSASLHGAIVATAYGVPVRLLAVQGMAKYRAFFDQLDRPEVVVDSWNLMGPAVIEALAAPRSPRPYAAMAQVRQFYADVWAALTTERDRAARGLELRRLVARLCRREMPIAHFIPSAALLVSSS